MTWSKALVHWRGPGAAFVSVVFSWQLPTARKLCAWDRDAGLRVHVGGPAVDLMPGYLADVAHEVGGSAGFVLYRHNAEATYTTKGCVRTCPFCAVPLTEGRFRELKEWPIRRVVCDNNLLASSRRHFDRVVDSLKGVRGVDFNQGLDARLLTDYHVDRLRSLELARVRFAFDNISDESATVAAVDKVVGAGFAHRRVGVYIMFGFRDSPDDALYRAGVVKGRGVRPFMQRYQVIRGPLALTKDSWIGPGWTPGEMKRFQRYWCRQNWFSRIPYADFTG